MRKFMDIDVPVILSENGFDTFSYVGACGIYHTNVRSIQDLLKRRYRNVRQVFLPELSDRKFKYFDLHSVRDFVKIALWVAYANVFIPSTIKGIAKSIRFRDYACMYEPLVAVVLTDFLVWALLRDARGRHLITSAMKHHRLCSNVDSRIGCHGN